MKLYFNSLWSGEIEQGERLPVIYGAGCGGSFEELDEAAAGRDARCTGIIAGIPGGLKLGSSASGVAQFNGCRGTPSYGGSANAASKSAGLCFMNSFCTLSR